MSRHAGAPHGLCGGAGACLPSSAFISGTNCRSTRPPSPPPKPAGAWRALVSGFRRQPVRSVEKTETYEILRHPEGGRKDILHWAGSGRKPVAELEIYRPAANRPVRRRQRRNRRPRSKDTQGPVGELEAAGVIDSKFGAVALLRIAGSADDRRPASASSSGSTNPLTNSGWSCQGDALPARRAAIGCMLDRLMLLTAGNEPKLAELFARAELKRGSCAVRRRLGDLGGLGDRRGKSPVARRNLIRHGWSRRWFSCNFFDLAPHYCDAVWPD